MACEVIATYRGSQSGRLHGDYGTIRGRDFQCIRAKQLLDLVLPATADRMEHSQLKNVRTRSNSRTLFCGLQPVEPEVVEAWIAVWSPTNILISLPKATEGDVVHYTWLRVS